MTKLARLVQVITFAVVLFLLSGGTFGVGAAELPPTILWNVTFDGGGVNNDDWVNAVAIGVDGHPVVFGQSCDPDYTACDFRTIKYDGATGIILWNVTFDGGDDDEGGGVAIGPDGHPIVTGYTWDPVSTTYHFRTIKYNGATGIILWNVTFDSGAPDQSLSVAVGADGHPVVTGRSCAPDYTACDFRTIKYDGATGAILWNVTFDSGNEDMSWHVAVGADGHPVVVGSSCAGYFPTGCDSRTLKLDGATGAVLWNVTFGSGNNDDMIVSVAVGADGHPVVTGFSCVDYYPFTGCDSWTLKLDGATGAILWNVTFDGGNENVGYVGYGVAIGADGDPVVSGQSCASYFMACVFRTVKHDGSTGAVIWNVSFDNNGTWDGGGGVATGVDGNLVVTGDSCAPAPDFAPCDFRTIKYLLQYDTPSGSSVDVTLNGGSSVADGVGVTYAGVSAAGSTTLITSTTGPTPPAGFQLGAPPTYYDIATTASVTAPIQVCINYTNRPVPSPESDLRLLHFEAGAWVDVTTSLDTVANVICGSVTSLSPFLIAAPLPVAATVEVKPEKWNIEWGSKNGNGKVSALIGNISGHSAGEIDPASVRLNGTLPVAEKGKDHKLHAKVKKHRKGFEGPVLEVRFNKFDAFRSLGPVTVGQAVTVKVTGKLRDGTPFEGTDTVLIVGKE